MRFLAILLSCVLLVGCGDEQPAPKPAPKPPAPKPEPKAPPEPVKKKEKPPPKPKEEPKPAVSDAEFEARLKAILDLEQDAEFFKAMVACREANRDLRGHPRARELDALAVRLNEEKRIAAQVTFAIDQLKSDSVDVVTVASKRLVAAGDVGLIYLRKAVGEQSDAVAEQTVKILAELRDQRSLPLFIERLRRDPPEPLASMLLTAIQAVIKDGQVDQLRPLWPLVKNDQAFKHRGLAAYFTTFLGDEGAPGQAPDITGDPESPALLKAYVQRAMKAEDEAVKTWAHPIAPRVGLGGKGLRGQYFEGTNFEKLILTRLDAGIFYNEKTLPLPEGKRENISVRWTGRVLIPVRGRYMFAVVSDDGQRLWVNGRKLTELWADQAATERRGQIQLDAGSYPIKLEYYNGGGQAHIELLWKRPGNKQKERIPAEFLRSLPVVDGGGE